MNYGWLAKLDNRAVHYLLLAGVAGGLFFLNLGGPTLWDLDEGRNATAAYEMMEAGNWIVPTFNAELRADKPALLYWLQILAFWLLDISEGAARLPSAVAGLLTLGACYELGRRMFTSATGLLAALMVAATPMLCSAARFANPDALLNLFTCLTLLLFWTGMNTAGMNPAARGMRRTTLWFVSVGLSAGFAGLAKGPVGILLPAAVIVAFLAWTRQLAALWDRRWAWTLGACALLVLPWYILVAVETKGNFWRGFFWLHNVNRFLAPMENHGAGPWFYLVVLALGFAPWSAFLPLAAWHGLSAAAREAPRRVFEPRGFPAGSMEPQPERRSPASTHQDCHRFLGCWIIVYLLFYSLAATKLPNYILPAAVPLAVVVARFFDRWRTGEINVPAWTLQTAVVGLGLSGLVLGLGFLVVGGTVDVAMPGNFHVPGLTPWAVLGLFFLVGSGVGWWLVHKNYRHAFVIGLTACTIAFLLPVAAWMVTALNQVKAPQPLIARTGAGVAERDIRLACFHVPHLPSLNFYSRRDVAQFHQPQQVVDFLQNPLAVYLFLPENRWAELQPCLPNSTRVLARHPDMYRGQVVLVITNQ